MTNKNKKEENNEEMDLELEEELEDELEEELEEELEGAEELEDESLEETIQRLQAESEEYLDGWQRARAEFANYKKRIEKEREETRRRITGEVITRYLGIMDDLERALAETNPDDDRDEWIAGVELIYQKFKMLLESEGVEPIEPVNVPFDPNFHEAVTFEESDDVQDGYVIDFTQRGYTLGGRVLRPAMVRVAK